MLKVLAVTGGRADWGLLAPPLAMMRDDPYFSLSLAVTGQHLSAEGSGSLAAIEADGFCIDERVDMSLTDDSPAGLSRSLGLGLAQFGQILARTRPDMTFILGDRYELLAPVHAALLAKVPIAHVAGGDITEGAFDDLIRHSITKMAHLHFVTNSDAAARVCQMGEDEDHVFNVGSPGLDRIRQIHPLPYDEFVNALEFVPRAKNAIITFHPATLSLNPENDCRELLAALDRMSPKLGFIFTGANADPTGRALNALIADFVTAHSHSVMKQSLGSLLYFSALSHVDLVIGNSSSGICEAPTFQIPTVNIGDRQKGRMRTESIIDCEPYRDAICAAIEYALTLDCSNVVSPYGDGHASERIIQRLKSIGDPAALIRKHFENVSFTLGPHFARG